MCHHFFASHMVLFPGRGYHPGDHHICYKTFARAHHQPRKTKMKAMKAQKAMKAMKLIKGMKAMPAMKAMKTNTTMRAMKAK